MLKSVPYHPDKIARLQDPEYSSGYLTAILEEKYPEPELLESALQDVWEALSPQIPADIAKQHGEKLVNLRSQLGSQAVYNLAEWLDVLGLQLTITVKPSATTKDVEVLPQVDLNLVSENL